MKSKAPIELRLDELAKGADTSARTVRYYVQRGLLPPPVFRGKDSAYGEAHLVRLRAIQKLQSAFFPLDAIKGVLDAASDEEIARIADGRVPSAHSSVAHLGKHEHGGHAAAQHGKRAERVVERVEKIALMPGVEILLSEVASDAARKFVERFVEEANKENSKWKA